MRIDWEKVRLEAEAKAAQHACPREPYNARTYLRAVPLLQAGGAPVQPVRFGWTLKLSDDVVMISHCPWCGGELPRG